MTKKELDKRTGSLSAPSKMPCSGYSIPAQECKLGKLLQQVKNSTCSDCYALGGRYTFPNVINAMYYRLNTLLTSNSWAKDMTEQIRRFNKGDKNYFRFHDSGDIQDRTHFEKVKEIANNLPTVNFWLPTREFQMLKGIDKTAPDNLTVRFSSHMVDHINAETLAKKYSSIVVTSEKKAKELAEKYGRKVYVCPATKPTSNHKCNSCRACWHSTDIIAYLKH